MPELLEQPMIETDPRTFNLSPDILDDSGHLCPEEQVADSSDGLPLARVASLATTQEAILGLTPQAEPTPGPKGEVS
ncbi:MAG TPA: hypothetical protein VMR45_02935 [Patescibacteria group bacterium]|nr:hypothetical protein [Patescibacteria group bacterium]